MRDRVPLGRIKGADGPGKERELAFSFDLLWAEAGPASPRRGIARTPHGTFATPAFMPVGTQATVKAMAPWDLRQAGVEIVLANTYHLYLRPGAEVIANLGGLHRFMGWDGPILTDSGGFQVFSLEHLRQVDEDGVRFRSHLDGSEHYFTPELVIQVQEALGADIIMCLDECAPPHDRQGLEAALDRTHRWAERCREAQRRPDQALFGIVQGGIYPDLRERSADFLVGLDFPGYAIGGLSVGESKEDMHRMLEVTVPRLPEGRPRYLMGVGSPEDLWESVARGIDMFDCVLPTRVARNGAAFTWEGRINLRNAQYARDPSPLMDDCDCLTCQHFSRAYLRHLFQANEILGLHLVTAHNLRFFVRVMERIRSAIARRRFGEARAEFLGRYRTVDQDARRSNRGTRRREMNE
ncbi:MAG: tRNA guanosine(34) transglycosylase Tgt [Anaerolineae bacterium]|nr:tRNA guanosine(34) transglycosylase Tgt [Anaerolineae bacterium]